MSPALAGGLLPTVPVGKSSQLVSDKGARTINWGKEYSFQQMCMGQLDIPMQKNEIDCLIHITYKNRLNTDQRPKCKLKLLNS